MQVILDSSFARPGSAPIWGGKKGEFRDWTKCNIYIENRINASEFRDCVATSQAVLDTTRKACREKSSIGLIFI